MDRGAIVVVVTSALLLSIASVSDAYRPGDIVPMSKMGQYHSSRTVWHDVIGRHCPVFAVNREVLIPIPKPTGFTGADPYKISFQVGREKYLIPWLYIINRKSSEVPMIDVHLRYSGSDLLGVTAKVVDMPHHLLSKVFLSAHLGAQARCGEARALEPCSDVEIHPDIRKQFWDPEQWPKHVLVRYTWEERTEINLISGFYVLFGSAVLLTLILSIYILESSKDKLARFVKETVAESSTAGGGFEKLE